ncbi:MAG: hypothetical protein WC445_01270 [Patescibacteria group bacterium]
MKKILIILLALISVGLISGCSNGIKTVNDLKKELSPIKAEYEKCIAEVQAYQDKFDKEFNDCAKMPDGIDCIGGECGRLFLENNYKYPLECNVCNDTKRYNDGVNKNNECLEKVQRDPNQLTVLDCTKLLTQ